MSTPVVTSAILCRRVESPDGDEGQADLIGTIQQIVFVANYDSPDFNGFLFLRLEADGGTYPMEIHWYPERGAVRYQSLGSVELADGERTSRAVMPIRLPCPVDGWYVLEILLGGQTCSRQLVQVSRPPA